MDVIFVDLPIDFFLPTPSWNLGYRTMIATLRQAGFSAAILHPIPEELQRARDRLISDLVKAAPKIAGFTAYDNYLPQLFGFIRDARRRGLKSHITIGGICASAIPEEILNYNKDVDSVVCGEGELSIVELAKTVVGGESKAIKGVYIRQDNRIIFGGMRPLIEDLDGLPSPVTDDFIGNPDVLPSSVADDFIGDLDELPSSVADDFIGDIDELPSSVADDFIQEGNNPFVGGNAFFIASRGCYGRCTFCSLQRFYRSCEGKVWRGRSPQKIAGEISEYIQKYRPQRITFVDENFMGPGSLGRRHAIDVAAALRTSRIDIPFNFGCRPNDVSRESLSEMKEANLSAVTLGIESMWPETLTLFNKGTTVEINENAVRTLEELELFLEITFIFFHPLSSLDEIRKNLQFVEYVGKSRFAYFNKNMPFTVYYPFFNTEYTQKLTEMKLVGRTLRGWEMRYRDPRVGFIVGKIESIPLEQLSNLTQVLRTTNPELQDVVDSLRAYNYNLNMVRLPELVSDCCDFFASGGSPESERTKLIEMEFDKETEKIRALYGLLSDLG